MVSPNRYDSTKLNIYIYIRIFRSSKKLKRKLLASCFTNHFPYELGCGPLITLDLCAAKFLSPKFQELFSKIVEKDAKLTKDDFVYHVPRLRRGGP